MLLCLVHGCWKSMPNVSSTIRSNVCVDWFYLDVLHVEGCAPIWKSVFNQSMIISLSVTELVKLIRKECSRERCRVKQHHIKYLFGLDKAIEVAKRCPILSSLKILWAYFSNRMYLHFGRDHLEYWYRYTVAFQFFKRLQDIKLSSIASQCLWWSLFSNFIWKHFSNCEPGLEKQSLWFFENRLYWDWLFIYASYQKAV